MSIRIFLLCIFLLINKLSDQTVESDSIRQSDQHHCRQTRRIDRVSLNTRNLHNINRNLCGCQTCLCDFLTVVCLLSTVLPVEVQAVVEPLMGQVDEVVGGDGHGLQERGRGSMRTCFLVEQ